MKSTKAIGLRFDEDTIWLMQALAKKLGVSRMGIVRQAIRYLAEREGLWPLPPDEHEPCEEDHKTL